MKIRPIVTAALLALIVGIGVPKVSPQRNQMPAPCLVGRQAPAIGFWTWSANSIVKVYVRTQDFDPEQTSSLLKGLADWNSVSQETGAGVKFEYRGSTDTELSCAGCLTVMRGVVFDKRQKHLTELKAYSALHNQLITYATIIVDPVLTNPKALLNAVQHELGHNLGLLDCYTCERKSTVMNQFTGINKSNGLAGPTPCDIAQVREAYRELKVRVRPSPPNRNLIDEGEEPVDDDTPIVIPKP